MIFKFISAIFALLILGCHGNVNNTKSKKATISSIDTTVNDYSKILTNREKRSIQKDTDSLGELITTISFNVSTDNRKDFEDGIIPGASIENPEKDMPRLIDKYKIIIPESRISIIIDYPLTNEYIFDLRSKNGFTRKQLLNEISKSYYRIYDEEEKSATIKTIPINKRTKMYNRNETNGKYGIWGHDIADLVLVEILVYKTANGQIVLSLNIES